MFTDQDIISNIIQESTQQESEESDDDDEGSPSVSHSSAVKMFDECLQWLQTQEEASMYNICMLQELRELKHKNAKKSFRLFQCWTNFIHIDSIYHIDSI